MCIVKIQHCSLLDLTSVVLSGPLLWFCRKRQPSLASLWTISSLVRSSLSCRMHMLLCCSVGDTEKMYLRPQSHDIASLPITGSPPHKKARLWAHSSIEKWSEQLQNSCLYSVSVLVLVGVCLGQLYSKEAHTHKISSAGLQKSLCAWLYWKTDSLSVSLPCL